MVAKHYHLSDLFDAAAVVKDGTFCVTDFSNTEVQGALCAASNKKFLRWANRNPNVTCIITPPGMVAEARGDLGVVVAADPVKAFYQLHNRLVDMGMCPDMEFRRAESATVHPSAVVSPRTFIGERVIIGPHAVVGDYTYLSDDVVVGPQTTIGADCYFHKRFDGELFAVKHAGGVWLGRRVEVLAGAVVSRSLQPAFTIIGDESVVSVQAHVGHGVRIGCRTNVMGNAQVSGYSVIGDDVWIGPGSVITNLTSIGSRARIEMGAVVVAPVAADEHVSGNFAYTHSHHMHAFMRRKMGEE